VLIHENFARLHSQGYVASLIIMSIFGNLACREVLCNVLNIVDLMYISVKPKHMMK